jgi:MFS family permease
LQTLGISLPNTCIDEKGLPEETVAFLFLIGFVSAGISASFAGTFADRHGRRTACLAYCVIYSFSSLTLLTDNIYVLFFGRVLGGISGTLLWSVFESWLVAEFNKLMLEEADTALSAIFSMMTTSNTCVAIVAGLIAEWLVPFLLSAGCLSLAFLAISKYWVSWQSHLAFWVVANMNRARTMVLAIEPRPKVVRFCKKKRPRQSFHQRPP